MPGHPKERRVTAWLQKQADAEGVPLLAYVMSRLSSMTMTAFAAEVAAQMGESCSRQLLRTIARKLDPNAKALIEDARRDLADHLAEQTLTIAEEVSDGTAAQVAKGRLRVDAHQWLAARLAPELYSSNTKLAVSLDVGRLHLDALRQVNAERTAARANIAATPHTTLTPPTDAIDVTIEDAEPAALPAV